jgi:hypothetical protein
MRITNFRNLRATSADILKLTYIADVDVTTGFAWWKRTRTTEVRREYAGFWYFADSGEFTPGYVVETLCRAFEAKPFGERYGGQPDSERGDA